MQHELEPFQLVSVIRLTKEATFVKSKHIPKIMALLQNDDLLIVKTES